MKTGVWAQALVLTVVSLVQTGFCKERELSLQKYEKTEGSMLVCATCSSHATSGHARRRKNVEWCASKCKKSKKFKCRAFNFEKLKRTGKCHLLCCDRFAPGAQIQANANFTLYERKDYIRECIVGTGQYRGRRSWTKSNITCQAWSDSSIHDHTFYPDRYPKRDLRENFCRNPTPGKPGGPWCYTTDPNIRVEECGIPKCSEEVCMTCNGEDYRGRVDETESGRECRRWDSLSHPFQGRRYRDKDLKDNYCRNPNNQLRPWCYTMETDKRLPWEYCNISVCDPPEVPSVNITTSCVRRKAADYRGKVNTTPKGVSCQRWDSQFPHNHTYHPQNYKCRDLKENYCRNPDGSDYPWCFTMDPKQRRANCTHIPRCDAGVPQKTECYKDNGEAYQGTLSMTRSGIPCGNWSHHINSRDPHSAASHVLLEKNYCRNPDRDKHGPWCYTNSNSRLTWDYCELKKCESPQISAPLSNLTTPTISCIVHINTRIVGGHRVHGSDGSWVVSIQRENNHLCGGTLVREDWVLTDQQCFTSCVPDLKDYSVQVGLRHLNASSNHPRLHISRLICGPEGSNLVLLKLEKPAPVSEGATSIHLPVRECHIREGTNCTMYGWGETKNTGHEESLKAVTMPMVNNEVCSRLKDGAGDSRVCAGGKRGEGVCDKDNGGPLVCQEHERKVIIGVSVQRTKCASSQPALFVNVAFYSEWIYKVFKLYPS